jgi:hypothetical protein
VRSASVWDDAGEAAPRWAITDLLRGAINPLHQTSDKPQPE